ncbi:MAG: M23 family metallopeptidase [Promethearchaeota archaeon]|nr:MAG: M23 family metallopeptidase [Candidatus Lokiarchaeota archaeon]
MKKSWKIILIILTVMLAITGIIIPILPFLRGWNPAYGTPAIEFPMSEPLNVTKLSAYNTPNWGEPGKYHNGIELVIEGPTDIISPCYGTVNRIWYNINPYTGGEVAMIHVSIRINYGWSVKLVFEPWANTTEVREQQLAAITVKVGSRVKPGDFIGTLLYNHEYPHLHYMILNNDDVNPYEYSSPAAKAIFDEIAERTNSTIYYP